MNYNTFWIHTVDLFKAALGAALAGMIISFLQYIGAHIPALIDSVGPTGAGFVAIKAISTRVV